MVRYKIDVLAELKKAGWSSYRLQNEKVLSHNTYSRIVNKDTGINMESLNRICVILRCQPSDVIEIVPTDEEKIRFF